MSQNQVHIMLDLETLDNSYNAAIISVGVVAFTSDSIINEKEWHLDVDQQITQGRRVGWDTLKWWFSQNEKAKEIFAINHRTSVGFFCGEFSHFCSSYTSPNVLVWGNGASFDIPIIETLLKRNLNNGVNLPWKFWNHRCYRTIKSVTDCHKMVPFEGEKHGALVDAKNQALCLQSLWKIKPELEK